MTRNIFSLNSNSLAPFEKTGNRFWEVMVQGMSPDAGDEFPKTILVRYILSYFVEPFIWIFLRYLRDLCILCGRSF